MNKSTLPLLLTLLLGSSAAHAQLSLHIDIGLPPLPRLVVVQPGIQVVEGFEEEVFFNKGWYWCRRPGGWYRARSPRAHFDWVEARRLPSALIRVPPGHYRNWHHGDPLHTERREIAHERRDERRERREDRREDRHEHGRPDKHREEGEHHHEHR